MSILFAAWALGVLMLGVAAGMAVYWAVAEAEHRAELRLQGRISELESQLSDKLAELAYAKGKARRLDWMNDAMLERVSEIEKRNAELEIKADSWHRGHFWMEIRSLRYEKKWQQAQELLEKQQQQTAKWRKAALRTVLRKSLEGEALRKCYTKALNRYYWEGRFLEDNLEELSDRSGHVLTWFEVLIERVLRAPKQLMAPKEEPLPPMMTDAEIYFRTGIVMDPDPR